MTNEILIPLSTTVIVRVDMDALPQRAGWVVSKGPQAVGGAQPGQYVLWANDPLLTLNDTGQVVVDIDDLLVVVK